MNPQELILKQLEVKKLFEKAVSSAKGNTFFGSVRYLLIAIKAILNNNDSAIVPVMAQAPEGEKYPDIQPVGIPNQRNGYDYINVFSREHVNSFAKGNNLKVTYFDNFPDKAISLALIEKNQKEPQKKVLEPASSEEKDDSKEDTEKAPSGENKKP